MMVTRQEWETDVKNTKKEVEAYRMIAKGYQMLSELPENIESGDSKIQAFRAAGFEGSAVECTKFLDKLLALKDNFDDDGVLQK